LRFAAAVISAAYGVPAGSWLVTAVAAVASGAAVVGEVAAVALESCAAKLEVEVLRGGRGPKRSICSSSLTRATTASTLTRRPFRGDAW